LAKTVCITKHRWVNYGVLKSILPEPNEQRLQRQRKKAIWVLLKIIL
jgi:hypothetical protein